MTKEQLIEKCNYLFKQIAESMPEDLDNLLASDGVEYESAENNYLLPKKIICAILKHEQWQYTPLSPDKKTKKEIDQYYVMI